MKIKTFLPVFSGFYETIWQYPGDNLIYEINEIRKEKELSEINFDMLDINYNEYEENISINLCKILSKELKDFVYSIEYEALISPKQYNYSTDSINCIIDINVENIKKFIYNNKEKFQEYLKNKYTSYDGFISHYSNDFIEWENETNNFTELNVNEHYLGSILQFICDMLEIDNCNLYEPVYDYIDYMEYINNYDDVMEKPSCSKCDNFITNEYDLKVINKYESITNKKPSVILCENCQEIYC